MGRLTRRVEEDGIKAIYINEKSGEDFDCFLENEYGYKTVDKLAAYEDIIDEPEKLLIVDKFLLEKCEEINELNKQLAEYKKLEEEGLLLRLPCNVGDTVYRINRGAKNPIIAMVVTEVTFKALISGKVIMKVFCSDDVMPKINGLSVYYEEEIGKKIFLTQEEAEQALERMKEVQDK